MKWHRPVIVQDIGYERYTRTSEGWAATTVYIQIILNTHEPSRETMAETDDRFIPLTRPEPVSMAPRVR